MEPKYHIQIILCSSTLQISYQTCPYRRITIRLMVQESLYVSALLGHYYAIHNNASTLYCTVPSMPMHVRDVFNRTFVMLPLVKFEIVKCAIKLN
jgi:hypothetical protein